MLLLESEKAALGENLSAVEEQSKIAHEQVDSLVLFAVYALFSLFIHYYQWTAELVCVVTTLC